MADPTKDELSKFDTLEKFCQWCGLDPSGDLSVRVKAALGDPKFIRDMVHISRTDWEATIATVKAADPKSTPSAVLQDIPLNAVQKGRIESLRRCCLLRCALPTDTPGQSSGTGGASVGGSASSGGVFTQPAGSGAGMALAASPTKKLKLSQVVDQTLDAEINQMSSTAITQAFQDYETTHGAEPHPDVEPSADQISALQQLLLANAVPYADFAVFGPYGLRMLRRLVFVSWFFDGENWKHRELPGPPDYNAWHRCWKVYRCALLLLKQVSIARLDEYGEFIRSMHERYGSRCWWLVYQADVRMRSEHFERIRRRLEAKPEHGYSTANPWNAVFAAAVRDSDFWTSEVKEQATLFLSTGKSGDNSPANIPSGPGTAAAAAISDDESGGAKGSGGKGGGKSKKKKSAQGSKKRNGGDKSTWDHTKKIYSHNRKGLEICGLYNSGKCTSTTPQSKCKNNRAHQCNKCLGPHMSTDPLCKGS